MKLYKYMSAKWAVEFLRTHELKVTTLEDTNDPDEWVPYRLDADGRDYLADPYRLKLFRSNVGSKYGFISLSSQMDNNVMWGHYADKFRGIVLEFETQPQTKIRPVIYRQSRYVLREATSYKDDEHLELIACKGSEWSYEAEWRCFVDISTCKVVLNGQRQPINFIKPEPDLNLSGIILGSECPMKFGHIMTELESWNGRDIAIRRMAHDSQTFALRVAKEFHVQNLNKVVTNNLVDVRYKCELTMFTGNE